MAMQLDVDRFFVIEPGLFQASRLGLYPPLGVAVVLNVSDTPNEFAADHGLLAVVHLPLADHTFPGSEWLELAVELLRSFRGRGYGVVVHCDMGESRSSLVLLAYLMRERGIGLGEALSCLRSRNPHADPNHRFLDGLAEFEQVCERARPATTQESPAGTGSLHLKHPL
jgi:protein-tyrosine phosphatase